MPDDYLFKVLMCLSGWLSSVTLILSEGVEAWPPPRVCSVCLLRTPWDARCPFFPFPCSHHNYFRCVENVLFSFLVKESGKWQVLCFRHVGSAQVIVWKMKGTRYHLFFSAFGTTDSPGPLVMNNLASRFLPQDRSSKLLELRSVGSFHCLRSIRG